MTDNKKKTPKKEADVTESDAIKPVKKLKIRETKEKLIEQALEEDLLPGDEPDS